MFEWIVDTKAGKIMKEWSEVFQPTYDDIDNWKEIKDIGKFSKSTIKEMQEAWATVPKASQKQIFKAFNLLKKFISSDVLIAIIKLYLQSIGAEIK